MTFNLLTTLGLRQASSLLDVGWRSLRIGRLLIPYLNLGKYFGVEPNKSVGGRRESTGKSRNTRANQTPNIFFFTDTPNAIRRRTFHSICHGSSISVIVGWI